MIAQQSPRLIAPAPTRAVTVAPSELIDQLVGELNQIHGNATIEVALRMGRLIVERFYGGDLTTWRTRKTKETSFRRLAARSNQDLRVSATFLYRAVALYELSTRVNADFLSRLTMTHVRAVLGLPANQQSALLAAADEKQWSTERLEEEALRVRGRTSSRRGRPPSRPIVKAVRRLVGDWRFVESAFGETRLPELSPSEVQGLYRAVSELKNRLDRLARELAASAHVQRVPGNGITYAGPGPAPLVGAHPLTSAPAAITGEE